MKHKHDAKLIKEKSALSMVDRLFPRPVCLEKCTMNIPGGYEEYILMTLKAFSNKDLFNRKNPHKLQGRESWSVDIKSRDDKYRMLYYVDNNVCKITSLCTEETH